MLSRSEVYTRPSVLLNIGLYTRISLRLVERLINFSAVSNKKTQVFSFDNIFLRYRHAFCQSPISLQSIRSAIRTKWEFQCPYKTIYMSSHRKVCENMFFTTGYMCPLGGGKVNITYTYNFILEIDAL
jgi:hypothetical protein